MKVLVMKSPKPLKWVFRLLLRGTDTPRPTGKQKPLLS